VSRLPPAGREAVELYYLEGRSIPQVARDLRLPPGTVKRRLHDARRRLADILIGTPGAWSKEES
jgi:RNA polymerase sigma-70 factor (ECF subfamily)